MSRPLRVLHLTSSNTGGGAGRFVLRLHERLARHGVESRVLAGRVEGQPAGWTALPRRTGARTLNKLGARIGLNYALLTEGFALGRHEALQWADVVHVHNLHGGWINYLSLPRWAGRRPALMTLHDEWPMTGHCGFTEGCGRWRTGCGACPRLDTYPAIATDRTALEWRLKRRALTRTPLTLVCPSDAMQRMARESFLRGQPTRLIPHGVDCEFFTPGPAAEARRRLGLDPSAFVLLVSAQRLTSPRKGILALAAKLAGLPAALRRRAVLLAFGEGGEELQRVSAVPCTWLGVLGDEPRKVDAYRAADVMVSASFGESFGLSALEAIACGTPVAAFDSGGIREVVRAGISGLLAPAGDWPALLDAVGRIAGEGPWHERCRELAVREFDEQRMAGAYAALYRELAAGRRAA